MEQTLNFQEEYSAKIPALTLLSKLGWQFLSPGQALEARGGKQDEVVLREVLREQLAKRRFTAAGQSYALSPNALDNVVNELCSPRLNEGLLKANETLYNHITQGVAVTEFVSGKKFSPTVQIIDWQTPENNVFHFTEEFTVTRADGLVNRRPDIVCFVNGLPLVVIEAKRPDGRADKGPTVNEGVSQCLRNQRPDEVAHLFAYSALLLSINGQEGRYGTTETPAKFWAAWREEDISEAEMHSIKNASQTDSELAVLFGHRKPVDLSWYQGLLRGGALAVTDQDRILIGLLRPDRLLDVVRYFTLFDSKVGKIVARYQQVFGIKRLLERIATKRADGGREGGVVWHTTGSGKSYTMVFLTKALVLVDELKKCRLVVVTDRKDLERQLSNTFVSGGAIDGKRDKAFAMATSGTRLAEQIGSGTERVIFSLIQKFNTATKLPECKNNSADVIVLIDEGHRSQGGENHQRMRLALPNASYVAFTGTPLLKDDKTENKFGPIVHAYTMQRAVEDKTVTPLLYEERVPDLDVNDRAIDSWFDRITEGLTEDQRADLKRKFAKKGQVYGADDRIRLIALDIANHFSKNVDEGLKAQVACDSKAAAIKYKKYLDEAGLFESAVVISAPDTREGNSEVDESGADEVVQWWKENVGSEDDTTYTDMLIKRFEEDDDLKVLIVVDKLLTGFDQPKNAVLYIDKPLKEHSLLQAIARVNRLHPQKEFGLLIDYRGILAELDTTLASYQDLASRTQGGYDVDDLEGMYSSMGTQYKQLPGLYKKLWSYFDGVTNKADIEQLRQVFVPKMQPVGEEMQDANLKVRDDFYEDLKAFSSCLKIAQQSAAYFEDSSFSEDERTKYKSALKQFSSLRQIIKRDAGETVDYDSYSESIKKLMDKHVVGVEVREPDGVYEVGVASGNAPEDWSEDKTRNETDIIKTRIAKKIKQDLANDPFAQDAFSKLLREAIAEAEEMFDHPLKQYLLFRGFEEKLERRELDDIPDAFDGNRQAQAYFGVFKQSVAEEAFRNSEKVWVDAAFEVVEVVDTAVAENSINPQNIEAAIRKQLLPKIFAKCKEVGLGMDVARTAIDAIIHITRVGFGS